MAASGMLARAADQLLRSRIHELDVAGERDGDDGLVHGVDGGGDLDVGAAQACVHLGLVQGDLQRGLQLAGLEGLGEVAIRHLAHGAADGGVVTVGGEKQ